MKDHIFLISRGFPVHICKVLSGTTLIMLERMMYLAIVMLLVQHRFYNHWSDGKHHAKVKTVN